jgi:hypothetical protein
MPFKSFNPHSFTQPAILANAPASPGVYGISSAREWIFIGEAADIRDCLLMHLKEPDSMLMSRHPTGFVFEMCHPALRNNRQDQLVLEYEPICNRRFDHRHRFGKESGVLR